MGEDGQSPRTDRIAGGRVRDWLARSGRTEPARESPRECPLVPSVTLSSPVFPTPSSWFRASPDSAPTPVFEASVLRVSYPTHSRLSRQGVTRLERREERYLARQAVSRRRSADRAAAARAAAAIEYARPAARSSDGWSDTTALVHRLRRTTFRRRTFRARQLLRPASAAASFVLVVGAVTPSMAHWVEETRTDVVISTGEIVVEVDGDLGLELEGCTGDSGEAACHKFEDADLFGLPVLASGETQFEILEWIDKADEDGAHVGFRYDLVGGSADLTIKSGNLADGNGSFHEITLEAGTHIWVNPWCEVEEGSTTATCDPKETSGISYIDICLTPPVVVGCDGPGVADVMLTNRGSVPFSLAFQLSDPALALCDSDATAFDVALSTVGGDGEVVEPPLYAGSLCFLVDENILVVDQLDPGDSRTIRMSVELGAGEDPPPEGIDVSLLASFVATQWNSTSGWTVTKTVPMSVTGNVATPLLADPEIVVRVGVPPPPEDPPDEGDDPPADDPPADDPPADDPPADDPPADDPPADDPPADDPPADDPPADDPPADDPPADDPPADDPVEQPPVTVTVSGVVWLDDGDGVRVDPDPEAEPVEPGEDRSGGVVVGLYDVDGELVAGTATDPDGLYEFADVPEGSYLLRFEAPGGFTFTSAEVGSDPALDSDVTDVETIKHDDVIVETLGWTDPIEFIGDIEPGLADAGIVPLPPAETDGEAPPAEDPGELATEPPKVAGGRDDEMPVDPHDPDDATPDDGAVDGADGGGADG